LQGNSKLNWKIVYIECSKVERGYDGFTVYISVLSSDFPPNSLTFQKLCNPKPDLYGITIFVNFLISAMSDKFLFSYLQILLSINTVCPF
jgi:hypothetical protein